MQRILKPSTILFITTILALIFYSWGINSWRFSFIPDEWPFYIFAHAIVDKNFLFNPLNFNGVYTQNTVLSSMYQAVFLKIFGISAFAWRFSNVILIIPITIFFYKWMKNYFEKEIALISTILLQSSFYLANFFKVGKNMPQALALLMLCLYLSTRCVNQPSKKNFVLLGITLGIAFYIYIGPIFPLIIWPVFLPYFKKENFKKMFRYFFILFLSYLAIVLPVILQFPTMIEAAKMGNFHHDFTNSRVLINIFHNFLLFYKNYDFFTLHYVAGPYLDLITMALAFCGTFISLFNFRKFKYSQLLLVYIIICIFIGATNPYEGSPSTRGIFFIPFGAAFAGIALFYLTSKLKRNKALFLSFVLGLVFILNIYKSQIGVFQETGYTGTAYILKTLQEAHALRNKNVSLLVSSTLGINNYLWLLPTLQQAYGVEDVSIKILRPAEISCAKITNANLLVMQYDKAAIYKIESLKCGTPYTKLTPKIDYF